MTNHARVLERVEEDLRRGHSHVAIQRLTTLVHSDPTNLDLRRRLGEVHLSVGNWVEAGRWTFLEADRDPRALAAFEKAHQDARARLEVLHWPVNRLGDAPEPVRHRLEELDAAIRQNGGRGVLLVSRGERFSDVLAGLGGAAFVLVNIAVWVLGYVALARWIW